MTSNSKGTTAQTDALVQRLFRAATDTLEIASIHLGGRLGFHRALAEGGDATPAELAARTDHRGLRARVAGATGGGRVPVSGESRRRAR